jgi:hypothetical protein
MSRAEPPQRPSGGEGRSWLRHELVAPEYHRSNPLADLLDWLRDALDDGVRRAGDLSGATTAAALVVLFALAAVTVLLVGRTRRARPHRAPAGAVLPEHAVTADELRELADRARSEGRHEDAVVDGFRALALRQHERGRVPAAPGATAHEVADALATAFPDRRDGIARGARLFDDVLYGHRTARADQSAAVLDLDDQLARG